MKLEFLDFETCEVRKVSQPVLESIDTNISINMATLEKNVLKLEFLYSTKYAPGGGFIRISGKADFSGSESKVAYEEWKKTKQIMGVLGEQIVNTINYSASINAAFIARVFNLTPPIVPPTIRFQQPVKQMMPAGKSKK
ncbi:MAG: hypothetical protein AABX38_01020 [Candidatus Micrarchaeota archaeon]